MGYRKALLLLFLMFLAPHLASTRGADKPAKPAPSSLNDLSMEVAALQALYQFDFTPSQLKTIRKLAKETADEAGPRQAARASNDFRQALAGLRAALIDATDDERIGKLQEKVDGLRESENPDLDDALEITDEARSHAPELLALLSARQVGAFVAGYGDDFPDPLERLQDALGRARGLGPKEWKKLREEVSEEVGRLIAGLDAEKAGEVADKVVQLLIHARALKDEEFKKQRPELENSARQIVGSVGAFDVIRHVVEQALAELLSNPRLPAALDARLKQ